MCTNAYFMLCVLLCFCVPMFLWALQRHCLCMLLCLWVLLCVCCKVWVLYCEFTVSLCLYACIHCCVFVYSGAMLCGWNSCVLVNLYACVLCCMPECLCACKFVCSCALLYAWMLVCLCHFLSHNWRLRAAWYPPSTRRRTAPLQIRNVSPTIAPTRILMLQSYSNIAPALNEPGCYQACNAWEGRHSMTYTPSPPQIWSAGGMVECIIWICRKLKFSTDNEIRIFPTDVLVFFKQFPASLLSPPHQSGLAPTPLVPEHHHHQARQQQQKTRKLWSNVITVSLEGLRDS